MFDYFKMYKETKTITFSVKKQTETSQNTFFQVQFLKHVLSNIECSMFMHH